jgi:plastocyanin
MSGSCDANSELLSAAVDDELTAAERTELDAHLVGCRGCRDRLDQLTDLRRRTLVSSALPRDELVQRVGATVTAEVRRRRIPSGRVRVAAAAAIVVVGLCVAGMVLVLGDQGASHTTARPTDRPGRVVTVKIMDQQVALRHVTIHRGDVVRWVNTDLERHQLVIDSDGAQIEGDLPRRGVQTVTYTAPGTYRFDCVLHPNLSGTVTVL